MHPEYQNHAPGTDRSRVNPFGTKQTLTSTRRFFRVDRREISYLKFILEAYDGIAVLTTVDPVDGMVLLTVAPGCMADVRRVLAELAEEILIRELDPGAETADMRNILEQQTET